MATVTRFYTQVISAGELALVVGPSVAVVDGSAAWVAIQYDDALGLTDTLDEYMGSLGYVVDAAAGQDGIRVRSPDGTTKAIAVGDAGELEVPGFPPPTQAALTNNVTAGGVANTIADFPDTVGVDVLLAASQTDVNARLAVIRANQYQTAKTLADLIVALKAAGVIQ